jgi:hypothetical protein
MTNIYRVFHDLWILLQEVIFLILCDQKFSFKHVPNFGQLRSYGNFFNSRTHPCVNHELWNQLAGNVINLGAFHLAASIIFAT